MWVTWYSVLVRWLDVPVTNVALEESRAHQLHPISLDAHKPKLRIALSQHQVQRQVRAQLQVQLRDQAQHQVHQLAKLVTWCHALGEVRPSVLEINVVQME